MSYKIKDNVYCPQFAQPIIHCQQEPIKIEKVKIEEKLFTQCSEQNQTFEIEMKLQQNIVDDILKEPFISRQSQFKEEEKGLITDILMHLKMK